jgi:hypothetical protein
MAGALDGSGTAAAAERLNVKAPGVMDRMTGSSNAMAYRELQQANGITKAGKIRRGIGTTGLKAPLIVGSLAGGFLAGAPGMSDPYYDMIKNGGATPPAPAQAKHAKHGEKAAQARAVERQSAAAGPRDAAAGAASAQPQLVEDPRTGYLVDKANGIIVDPTTGIGYTASGAAFDARTGQPVDPRTAGATPAAALPGE